MNVTSAQYQNLYMSDGTVEASNYLIQAVIDGKTCTVPIEADNLHYKTILEWVAEGNTIQDAD